ncbi:hypothetical protein BH11MYX1_BH11MYX1_05130 [soil metagenome]
MEDDDAGVTEAMDIPPVDDLIGESATEPSAPEVALEGTSVGGYTIDGELGRGGMGVVYSGTHPIIGKRAAIKVLKASLSNNPATIERFIQEARSVNAIGHPNIVDIFDFDILPDGRRYLVMDLLEGESLRKRVKRGPLPIAEALVVLDEVASALDAAHAKGFIHRDLKPDNVFLVTHPDQFDVKLLDFGLAKLMANNQLLSARAYRTATGAQLGTPDYMSPEQLRGDKAIDHRTDIFALGVLAFEILEGQRPRRFATGGFDLVGSPSQALAFSGVVPADISQLVGAMLEEDPADRPTLVAVRAVIKRVRPALSTAPDSNHGSDLGGASLDLSASAVGATPLFSAPPAGSPLVPATRAMSEPALGVAGQLANLASSGIRAPKLAIATTRLGVGAPATVSRAPRVAEVRPPVERRWWLIVGAVLVLAAAVVAILAVT